MTKILIGVNKLLISSKWLMIFSASLLFLGCAHNISIKSTGSVLSEYPEAIKVNAFLVVPKKLTNYVYKGTGSAVTIPGLPLEDWIFPVGKLTSDLIQKGVPSIFEKVEIKNDLPTTNDLKKRGFKVIIKPSIEYFNFRPSTNTKGIFGLDFRPSFMIASWVEIKYKLEVSDLDGKVLFQTEVTGVGASKTSPTDFASKVSLGKSAEMAIKKGVNLLLNSLYESAELRKSF